MYMYLSSKKQFDYLPHPLVEFYFITRVAKLCLWCYLSSFTTKAILGFKSTMRATTLSGALQVPADGKQLEELSGCEQRESV